MYDKFQLICNEKSNEKWNKMKKSNNETKTVMKRKLRTAMQTVRKTKYKENS